MSNKTYKVREALTVEERNDVGGVSDIVAHLLFHRGHTDRLSADIFLAPDYDAHIHDPFLFKNMEKAVERIVRAIENNELITLYSDYDADGIPGAVMWDDFFKRLGYANYSIYIPHRHNEGFGLNIDAIEQLVQQGVTLIITLDCGVSDVIPVIHANKLGIEVIITDHHEPPEVLPPAYAVIDHKQIGCSYPDKNLCGSAVGYKLIQAIIKQVEKSQEAQTRKTQEYASEKKFELNWKQGHEKWLLDMVGIATLSDMVPLVGENRVFAYYGLSVLRKSQRKGLVKLLAKLKIAQKYLTEDDVGFMITPRINAASRMGVPMDAFKLLTAETDEDAKQYADHLDEINNERKGIVAALVKEVKKIIIERYGGKSQDSYLVSPTSLPSAIVLGNPDWKPSLLGLAANTCAEEFDRPVFLWGRDGDNVIKGSCRSEGVSSVVDIMRCVPKGVFVQCGGHKYSGGFVVSNEQVFFLEKHLNEAAEKIKKTQEDIRRKSAEKTGREKIAMETGVDPTSPEASQDKKNVEDFDGEYVDMELTLDAVNWRFQEDIDKLAPFGMSNSKPLFIFRKVIPSSIRRFGKTQNHIEMSFIKTNGSPIVAISFFTADAEWVSILEKNKNQSIDLVASVEKSMFRGRKELRLRVVDVLI